MKSIENKKFATKIVNTDYFGIMKEIFEKAPPSGYAGADGMKVLRMRLKCLDVIDEAIKNKSVNADFEDAQFEALKEAYKSWNWGITDRVVLEFDDMINT